MLRTVTPTTRAVGLVAASGLIVTGLAGAALANNVNTTPIRDVKGTNTALSQPIGLTRDASGKSYVSDFTNDSVSVFGKTANGDVGPQRTIKGPNTLLDGPESMAVDDNGFLYVANVVAQKVTEYAPGASGNVAPANSFGTGGGAFALALDDSGRIYVGDAANAIKVFGANATGGAPAPLRTISGANTQLSNVLGLVVDDHSGRVWAANGAGNSVLAFSPTATGDEAPTRVIKGDQTGLSQPRGIALDGAGRIYVTNSGSNVVSVFAPNASGNVAPIRTLSGVATTLSQPWGVSVASGNVLSVVNVSGAALATYGPLFPATKPGKPTDLQVAGARGATNRPATWDDPASDGGADITGYHLVVKKGTHTVLTRNVGGATHKVVLKRSQLADGINKVFVSAKNAKGTGPAATRTFVVNK